MHRLSHNSSLVCHDHYDVLFCRFAVARLSFVFGFVLCSELPNFDNELSGAWDSSARPAHSPCFGILGATFSVSQLCMHTQCGEASNTPFGTTIRCSTTAGVLFSPGASCLQLSFPEYMSEHAEIHWRWPSLLKLQLKKSPEC